MIEAFVGRDHQLSSLEAACTQPGGARVVLVEGPAGIGKTRLLAEFARRIADRRRVIAVAATEFEQGTPLRLVTDVLEQLAPVGGSGPAIDAQSEDTPGGVPITSLPHIGVPEEDPRAIARTIRSRLELHPAVLIVDDLHWADTASLRVLALLSRQSAGTRTRVVLAYRQGQFPALLGPALRPLGGAVAHLAVPPLTDADTAALLPTLSTARRNRLLAASHGNPLYLLLLADHSLAQLDAIAREADSNAIAREADSPALDAEPAALDRTLRAELAQLPAVELRTAQAAALCGPTADLDLLCAAADIDVATLTPALDELTRRGWLTTRDTRIAFRHPLIRTAAYGLLGPAARAAAHRRAATHLRDVGAPLLDRARHLEHSLCGRDDLAATELLHAAEEALASAPATSARWAAAALRAAPSPAPQAASADAARLLLGRALLLSGAAEDARRILEDLAVQPGPRRLEATLLQARCERVLGRADRARALLAAAIVPPTSVSDSHTTPSPAAVPAASVSDSHTAHSPASIPATPSPEVLPATSMSDSHAAHSPATIPATPSPEVLPATSMSDSHAAHSPATIPATSVSGSHPAHSSAAIPGTTVSDSYVAPPSASNNLREFPSAFADGAQPSAAAIAGQAAVQLELAILEIQDNRDAEGAARVAALFTSGAVRDPAIRAAATTLLSMGRLTASDIPRAWREYRSAEQEFARLSDSQLLDGVHAVAALGWMSYFLDDQRTGLAHIERAIRVSRQRGRNFILPELHTVQAYSLAKLGRFAEALAAAEDAAETAGQFGYHDVPPLAGAVELRVLAVTAPRAAVLERWRAVDAMPRPVMRWWRGVVEAALDEYGVKTGLETTNPIAAQADTRHPMRPTELAVRARAALAHGHPEQAAELVARAEESARASGLPGQLAAAAHARAEYDAALGDIESATVAAQTAVDAYSAAEMPVQRAQALLLAAQLAGRQGDFGLATARIAAARTELKAIGAHELVAEAVAAQRRLAGSRPVSGATVLTGREREVADLAAQGLSNKEIASRLYLSPRTVEDHLGRILRKLGITGRAGIAHRLAELDDSMPPA
ncbi:helix-turn-helix transcriptional regulator [Nocardia inohanensis]|uniref:helix-turn-helix transcriptional regulator n=1 Tax=Nocardia inohanensis TaxID=209246 RepID=UPI00082A411F|nr:LuxR family transcriptional regulator [Nocardia inohanensis]